MRKNEQSWESLPKYDLNTGLEVIYMENKAKGIFRSPLGIYILDHTKDKNKYIKKQNMQSSSLTQNASAMFEKGKAIMNNGE